MYYKNRGDGGTFIGSSKPPEKKKGRTYVFDTYDSAAKRFPEASIEKSGSIYKVTF